LKKYNPEIKNALKILNPLTKDSEILRPSLVPSLLAVIAQNQNRAGEGGLKIFELANTYQPPPDKASLPDQRLSLCLAANSKSILQLKKILETVFVNLGTANYSFWQYSQYEAAIKIGGRKIGNLSYLNPKIQQKFNISGPTAVAEINFKKLIKTARKFKKYAPISKFPPIIEVITLTLPKKTRLGPVIGKIKACSKLIRKVEIRDTYQNNYTFRIRYQSSKKPLRSKDLKQIRSKIKNIHQQNN